VNPYSAIKDLNALLSEFVSIAEGAPFSIDVRNTGRISVTTENAKPFDCRVLDPASASPRRATPTTTISDTFAHAPWFSETVTTYGHSARFGH